MAGEYVFGNGCTLNVNEAWNEVNLEGLRKGLYSELFFIFFIHFILQIVQTFMYKSAKNKLKQSKQATQVQPPQETDQSERATVEVRASTAQQPNEDTRPNLPWHERRWNKQFSFIFSSHAAALGMVILFSPLAGAMVVAYMHLLVFIFYTISEVTKKFFLVKIFRTLMDLLNLTLMIIGTVGIGYNQSYDNGECYRNVI